MAKKVTSEPAYEHDNSQMVPAARERIGLEMGKRYQGENEHRLVVEDAEVQRKKSERVMAVFDIDCPPTSA